MDAAWTNVDWPKTRSWDFLQLPMNEAEMVDFLARHFPETTIDQFKRLPAYQGWLYKVQKTKGHGGEQIAR